LHDLDKSLKRSENKNNKMIISNKEENAQIEGLLRNIAQESIKNQIDMKTMDDESKDRIALTMKFLFEVKEDHK